MECAETLIVCVFFYPRPFIMASSRFWQYGALAIVFLAAMVLSVPFTNADAQQAAATPQLTDNTSVDEMRILVTWGDVDNNVGTVGTGGTMAWDGSITLNNGNILVVRPMNFKDANDRLINETGSTIQFQSDINSDVDGLFLRVLPQNGKTDELVFTLSDGFTVTRPLLSFVTNKVVTIPVRDGLSVRMELEGMSLKQGDLRSQTARALSDILKACKDSGKTDTQCQQSTMEMQKQQQRLSRSKIWDALNREKTKLMDKNWTGSPIHPDVLFLLSQDELDALSVTDLARMDLSKLSHMTDMVYHTLLRLVPNRLNELPKDLQNETQVLEGVLPDNVRTIGNLSADDFQRFKRFLASLDQTERQNFVMMLTKLSPANWDAIKGLDDETILSLGRILMSTPEANRDAVLKAYLRQATKIANLRIKLDQLRSRLSVDQAKTIEDMLGRLQGVLLWTGDDTPMILTAIDTFMAQSGALDRDSFIKALSKLQADVQQAIAENNVGLMKDNLGLFSDVSASSWYAGFVGMMRADGLLSGYKDAQGKLTGKFGPENPVTVAELLKISLETTGNGAGSGTTMVAGASKSWAQGYVARGEQLHLTILNDTNVDLNRPATRGEVVQTFLEAYGINPPVITQSSFSDVFVSMPAARFIEFAKNHGIVAGDDGKSTFRPNAQINRAEVAKIGVRMRQILSTLFDESTVEGDLNS